MIRTVFVVAFVTLSVATGALAQSTHSPTASVLHQLPASAPVTISGSKGCKAPEFVKANLELCKYLLEADKLDQQRTASLTTIGAVFFSALVGFGTILFNIKNANAQARLQAKLKALEVVISAAGPKAARQRLTIVDGILGSDLVPAASDPTYEIEGIGAGHDQARRELLKSLADHPEKRDDILADWHAVFGTTKLGQSVDALRNRGEAPVGQAVVSQATPNPPLQPTAEKRGG